MKIRLSILLIACTLFALGQNEFSKWYFGRYTGLDFMSNPPAVINHTTMNTFEGSASVADGNGNLLFYTDGITIWNKQQVVMANGTGLLGNSSTVQSALIVKQPGNTNIYYVFTQDFQGGANGLRYSLVDMSLAAGMGSVTVKNATITSPCTEQLSATRHCNGVDMWIITHELTSNNFRTYLLTASGLNLTPVISSIGPAPPTFIPNNSVYGQGTIKLSPNGKKLGLTFVNGSSNNEVAVFDFDKSSGLVSNYLSLYTGTVNYWGCEFSPDGTKFYSSNNQAPPLAVYQWDLCAGSNALVFASKTNIGTPPWPVGGLQLAPNGKIYLVNWGTQTLSAINNPNVLGLACNFTPSAQSVATGSNGACLPNFFGGAFKTLPSFSYTLNPLVSCATATFMAPPNPTLNVGCGASEFAVQSILWDFGQPFTGPANTSTVNMPTHNFNGAGVFPVKLILNYQCGADTIYQNVVIAGPTITVNSSAISCTASGGATVNVLGTTGTLTYTWLPSAQTTSAATVNPGSYTIHVNDAAGNCNYTHTTSIQPSTPLSATVNTTPLCYGANNGTANLSINMGTGGTGNYSYNWSNSQNTASVSGLSAGIYSVTVNDVNCSFTSTFQILQTPALSVTVISPVVQVCTATLQAIAAGGTPAYTYSWFGGPPAPVFVATQTMSGTQVFSVNVTDQYGCSITGSTQVNFLGSPALTVQNVSICINTKATLTVTGANNYTWMPGNHTGSNYTVSPGSTQVYTVTGSYTNGCSSKSTLTLNVFNCTAVDEEKETIAPLKILANPVITEILLEAFEPTEILLLDVGGRELHRQHLEIGDSKIDFTAFAPGIYYLTISGNFAPQVKKILKIE
ncbi:MAG: SprB repeat-containing protein [Bacteroidia bacterium]|jgi:hypothetical protein|nr:SprB repeat-containing protein [Bacteroidia bacterium]